MPDQPSKQQEKKKASGSSYTGHRRRVRQRFIMNGFDGMLKYEVLEAMLMLALPRRDVKPLAKKLLDEYKTVLAVISLPQHELERFPGMGENSASSLRMFFESMRYCLKEQSCERQLLATREDLHNFVRMKLGVHRHECCMAVFLNSRNYLLKYEMIAEGTVDSVVNHSRNMAEIAFQCNASKILLVHNHPSGVCMPTQEDIDATESCYNSLKGVGLELIDHLIVTPTECFSFADNSLVFRNENGDNIYVH
jgi:DNA repair protein RadC